MANPQNRTYSTVYNALKQISDEEGIDFGLDGYTEQQFKDKYFTGPGNINNLYNKLSQISDEEGVDFGLGTRGEWLGSFGFTEEDAMPKQGYKPTAEEMAGFNRTIQNAKRTVDSSLGNFDNKVQNLQKRQGLNAPSRIEVGKSNNLVQGTQQLNPETGKLENTYITSSGNKYDNEALADMEQRQIDQNLRDSRYRQSLPGQLDDAYAERDRLNSELAKLKGQWIDQDGRVHYGNRGDDEAAASLEAALRQNQQRITALEAERDDDGGTQFWRGFIDAAKNPSTLTFGMTDFSDMVQMMRIKNKMDAAIESGQEPQLSEAEQSLLESSFLNNYAQQQYGENRGFMYRAGGISMQALPFVAEFMATGGMGAISQKGAELGTRAAEKLALQGLSRSFVKNLGVLAGDVAAGWAMANTTGVFRTAGDVMQRNMGDVTINPEGNYDFGSYDEENNYHRGGKSIVRSIYEAEVANTLEYYTEKLGEHLKLGKWFAKGAEKMGLSKLSKVVNYLSGNKWLERGGIQDYPSEVVEEEANLILNAALVGDNKFSELDPRSKTQMDIWGGMLFSIGLMQAPRLAYTGTSAAGYYAFKKGVDIADDNASIVFGADNWQMIKDEIDNCENDKLGELMQTVINGKMTDVQKTATINYAKNLIKMRGYNMGMMAGAKDEEEATSNEGMAAQAVNQSYQQGHETQDPDLMKQYNDDVQAAEQNLYQYGEEFAKEIMASVNIPVQELNYLMNFRDQYFSDEQIAAAADYYQKRSRAKGMMDGTLDRIDLEIEKEKARVREETHQATGDIIDAVGADGQPYNIIGGDVVTDPDTGVTSLVGTGGAVVVRNSNTGEVSVKSPQELNISNVVPAETMIQYYDVDLRNQLMQQADEDITYGSPANETYQLEDTVALNDGNGNIIEGEIGMMPNSVDGVYVIYTPDGKALQFTADQMNRMIVAHNGQEVQRGSQQPVVQDNLATEQQAAENAEIEGNYAQNAPENMQSGTLDNATGENAAAEDAGQKSNQPQSALSRIPVLQDEKGQPILNKKGKPQYQWHKASVEDAAAALVETTGGNMVMARDNANRLVKTAQAKLEKIRKQEPRGEDPIELAENSMAIQKQIDDTQAAIKQWQDVAAAIQKQMNAESERLRQEAEAKKSEEQRQREAAEAEERKMKQDEIDRQRIREQIEKDKEKRNKEYAPLTKAKEEMKDDPDAMAILSDTEPRSLDEWVSSLLRPHSLLWQDASPSEVGLQSELGLKRSDMQRFMTLLGNKESNAEPFGKAVLDIYEALPEGMKNQYTDEDVRNTLLNLFNEGSSTRMMHLTEENRIDEARQTMLENLRRDAEAEMEAWAEANHLTPEERETYEDFLAQEMMHGAETEFINQLIEQDEQDTESKAMDSNSASRTAGREGEGGESQVQGQGASETIRAYQEKRQPEQGEKAPAGSTNVSDSDVSGGAQGIEDEAFIRDLNALLNDYDSGDNGYLTDNDLIERARELAEDLPSKSALSKKINEALDEYDEMQQAYRFENGMRDDDGSEAMIETLREIAATKPIGNGDFGPIYDQFRGKPKEAIDFLTKNKNGEALGALSHKDIGEIDLVWGEEGTGHSDGFGLAKLVKYHPEVLENLQEILDEMEVVKRTDNRINLESDKYKAAVRLTWNEQSKTWLLTIFEKKNSALDNTTDTGKTSNRGKRNDTATPQSTVSEGKDTNNSSNIQENQQESSQQPQNSVKRLVSDDRMEDLKKRLRNKLGGQLNVGVDPEILAIGAEIAVGYIERGVTKFADFAKAMIDEVGDFMRPYLKSFYNAVRDMPEAESYADQMEDYETVSKFDVYNFDKGGKVPDAMTKAEQIVNEQKVNKQAKKIKEQHPDLFAGDLFASQEEAQPIGKTSSAAKIATEEDKVDTNPTEAQKEAGNYQKGHIKVDGYDITIENPKGSIRRGVDANGKAWEQKMNNTYGYIRGTEAVDGDHIDIFLSDNPTSGKVFVVDQVKPDRSFDEVKVMYGFKDIAQAAKAYLSNYEDGWKGLGNITSVSREAFKEWIESSHRKTKPFREYALAKRELAKENTIANIDDVFTDKLYVDSQGNEGAINKIVDIEEDGDTRWYVYQLYQNDEDFKNGKVFTYAKIREQDLQAALDTKEWKKQSEQLKPTDLRDGIKPDTAELGAAEAKAKAQSQQHLQSIKEKVESVLKNYRTLAPIIVVDINSDEEMSQMLEAMTDKKPSQEETEKVRKDLKKSKHFGVYNPKTNNIYIFAELIAEDIIEEGFFHENLHRGLQQYYGNGLREIAEAYWDASNAEKSEQNKKKVAEEYKDKPENIKEEYLVQTLSHNMTLGSVDRLIDRLSPEHQEIIDNILTNIGYDREKERIQRKSKPSGDIGERRQTSPDQDNKGGGGVASSTDKIEDVGEEIAGARKDLSRKIAQSLDSATKQTLGELPFSKAYKKPDLKKAIEEGALRESDAVFYDAFFSSFVDQNKPRVTKTEERRKKYNPEYRTDLEKWVDQTHQALQALKDFVEADEQQRDRIIESLLADRYPFREKELTEIEKRKEWNKDRKDLQWGEKTTPNPLWITYEVMKRLDYTPGDKLDIPFGILKADTTGTQYSLYNKKNEYNYYAKPKTVEEGIDAIVWLARLKRRDSDIQHPVYSFYTVPTKSEMAENGKYRVIWGGFRNIQSRDFDSKEDAEAFASTKKASANIMPLKEVVRRFGYKVMFRDPLTGERHTVNDKEFDTDAEAKQYLEENYDEVNSDLNNVLSAQQKEKENTGKKELTPDDMVYTAMVRNKDGKYTYGVLIDKKYANNYGMPLVIKDGFATRNEAKDFAEKAKEEVFKAYQEYKAKQKAFVYFDTGADSRIGEDYRGGKDVTAEDFMNTFGFRGVQFGNWTNQADRQMAVNQAYDAFLDLAKLIGVSPKAISLNGELGIAFGARGSGNFAAHYEPGEIVINLTKTMGAGSLAHEWWHALDNYFARTAGERGGMVTDDRSLNMRQQLRNAFNTMLEQVAKSPYYSRSKDKGDYWGRMHEVTARLLAEWVDQELKKHGELNTFLSRGAKTEGTMKINYERYKTHAELAGKEVMPFEEYKKLDEAMSGSPYPSPQEVERFSDAMRNIFDVMQERIDDETGNVALYHKVSGTEAATPDSRETALRDQLIDLMKDAGIDVITDNAEGQQVLDEANGKAKESKVYHGSGSEFDAFDHSHMGEGEGSQAFGWGTYVTDSKGIGKSYARSGRGKYLYKGKNWDKLWHDERDAETMAALDVMELMESNIPFDEAVARAKNDNERSAESLKDDPQYQNSYNHYLERIEALDNIKEEDFSRKKNVLYDVEIPDDTGTNYIDWQKPLSSEQTEILKDGLAANETFREANRKLYDEAAKTMDGLPGFDEWNQSRANVVAATGGANGERLYKDLAQALGSEEAASKVLNELGFSGIKYPAGTIMGGGDGATNYVIFNENDAKITNKTKFFRTKDGQAYGYTYNGKIYVDPSIATAETPVHEYTHLWAEALRQKDPDTWNQIVSVLKNDEIVKPFWDKVARLYPELTDENDMAEEVLAQYSGQRGSEQLREVANEIQRETPGIFGKAQAVEALRRMKNILSKFWKAVADMMGWQFTNAHEIADKVLYDLLSGVNPKAEGSTKVMEQRAEDAETIDPEDAAMEMYNKSMQNEAKKWQEAWQDSMISLKSLQDAIAQQTGNKAKGAEDAYSFENRMHGRSKNMGEQFDWQYYQPMLKAFDDFCKAKDMTDEQAMDYLVAKHGLERNMYYAFRDAMKRKVAEEIKEEREKLEKAYALNRISEDTYKDGVADLRERELNGVDEAIAELQESEEYNRLKDDYQAGRISHSEFLKGNEELRREATRRKKPRMDQEGHIISDNYYDENATDYSGLTETFAKQPYDEAQKIKRKAQREIDPKTRKMLWQAYDVKMREAYALAKDEAENRIMNAEHEEIPKPASETASGRLWNAINAATKKTLQYSYESGMMDRKNYNKVRKMFDFYIPLRGWDENRASDVYSYVGRDNVFSPAVKKTWGRKSKADSPLAYIGNIAMSTIISGHHNQMKQHFLNYVLNNPTSLVSISESWYENIGTERNPMWILRSADTAGKSADDIAQIVNDFNEEMAQKQAEGKAIPVTGRLRLDVHATQGQKAEHVVEVQRAGHNYQMYINGDPRAAQALNGTLPKAVTRISNTAIGKELTKLNRNMAAFFTSKNPAFVVSNLSRDLNMAGASVAIKEGPAYNAQFIKNVAKVLTPRMGESSIWIPASKQPTGLMPSLMRKWKKGTLDTSNETERLFKEFMDEGGETGFVNMLSVDSFKEKMQKEIAQMHGSDLLGRGAKECSIKKGLRLMGETFEFYNRCAEDATRFIVYMTSRQMGKTLEESIADAKDVTLNFNRKGTGAKGNAEIRDLFIFVNPAIQALANMYKMATGRTLKFAGVTALFFAGGIIMPIINQWLLNMFGDDDDKEAYWNLPPWIRKNNLVYWIPFTKNFVTIPLAQEFRVFYGAGEMLTTALSNHQIDKPVYEILSSVADLVPINPTGNGGNLMIDLAPTGVQPISQLSFNTDFTGKPIWRENQGNKHAPMYTKAYVTTPNWMIRFSEKLNDWTGGNEGKKGLLDQWGGNYVNNPAVWNHLLQGYLGGMYNTITKTADVGYTAASGEMPKVMQVPVINRFLNRPVERENAGVLGEDYYRLKEQRDALNYELRTFRKKAADGDEEAQKRVDDILSSDEWRQAEVFNHYEKIINDLRNGEQAATESADKGDIKKGITDFKQQMMEELNAIGDGSDPLEVAIKQMAKSKTFEERNKLRMRIERLTLRNQGVDKSKTKSRSEEVEKALRYITDAENESRDTDDNYLMLATPENVRDDARIKATKAKIKKHTDEFKRLIDSGAGEKAAEYRNSNLKWFRANDIINQQERAMRNNKKLLGKGRDANIMQLIDQNRKQMLKAIEGLE